MNTKILELIKVVNDNYNHIEQLETLGTLLNTFEYKDEYTILKTTHNSHYAYKLFGHKKYQNPLNHIDCYIDEEQLKKGSVVGIDKSISITENPDEINWI